MCLRAVLCILAVSRSFCSAASYCFCEGKEFVYAITASHVLRASCFRKNATQAWKRVSQLTFMDSRCLVMLDEKCTTAQRVFYTLPYRQDDARTNYRVSRFRVIYRECKNDRIKLLRTSLANCCCKARLRLTRTSKI